MSITFETRQEIVSKFLSFKYGSMPYRLFVPENYRADREYPLVLFLHGGGERGEDNERHLLATDGAIVWATRENQAKHPSFVLAPQASDGFNGGFGLTRDFTNQHIELSRVFEISNDLIMSYEILQLVMDTYNIDKKRLYITGLSQGGFGTYNMNMMHPDLFAAMVPIAGGGDPDKAHLFANKNIWNFHAEDDEIIPVSCSRNIIDSIQNAGGNPIYTEYPADKGYNHGSWVPAYQNQEMIDWLFKQVKSDTEG